MARPKRSSKILEIAQQRLAGLKKITPKPDFGPSLKQSDYEAEITGYSDEQDGYTGISPLWTIGRTDSIHASKACAIGTGASFRQSKPNTGPTVASMNWLAARAAASVRRRG